MLNRANKQSKVLKSEKNGKKCDSALTALKHAPALNAMKDE